MSCFDGAETLAAWSPASDAVRNPAAHLERHHASGGAFCLLEDDGRGPETAALADSRTRFLAGQHPLLECG